MSSSKVYFFLFIFIFSFPPQVYAGDSPCMVAGQSSGFTTFILEPLNTLLISVFTYVLYIKILSYFKHHISIGRKIFLLITIVLFSKIPFLDTNLLFSPAIQVYYVGFIGIYSLMNYLILYKKNSDMHKILLINTVSYMAISFFITNLLFHWIREPLFKIYSYSGDASRFYTLYKDGCGYNFTYN